MSKASMHPTIKETLSGLHQKLVTEDELPTREQLRRYYATFRDKFGPDRLSSLDGEELLVTMHAHGSYDSLVYWLEFKNDEELPALFGSIAGGNAFKFGIFQRKEDGIWVRGNPRNPTELSVAEAASQARKHRDQLLQGVALLEKLPSGADDLTYRHLQEQLSRLAPDVNDSAWGHKYFSLLFPEKLDDFHVEHYQRFHLIKLLQTPPEGNGRYLCAGRYVAVANELDIPLNHLTTMLNRLHGRPYQYWRVGTKLGGTDSRWPMMRDNNCVAIGWSDLGDLSDITYSRESKETLREVLNNYYPNAPRTIGRQTQQIFYFITGISEGDLVLALHGATVLGIGRITGSYFYVPDSDAPHRRPVEWLTLNSWQQPQREGWQTAVFPLRKRVENLIEAERQILEAVQPSVDNGIKANGPKQIPPLTGIPGRIQSVLERKKQVILYGPPGTGKTYWARLAAQELAALATYGRTLQNLTPEQEQSLLHGNQTLPPLLRICTFHPAYGYEDFLEGYRPYGTEQLLFERRDGIFKKLCQDAGNHPHYRFYLIIDEINRGDIPRIFGELLTILEKDKRDQTILLPLSGQPFFVPENVYVIGTMNTADRSIALLDTALRRRFGFIELMPDSSLLKGTVIAGSIPLGPWLDALNERLIQHVGRDARNLQIGHAYLLENGRAVTDARRFTRILQDDLIPLLEEYCYEDYEALTRILGENLVDLARQRVRHELFAPERQDDLMAALLAPDPLTTTRAVTELAQSEELSREEDYLDENEEPAV